MKSVPARQVTYPLAVLLLLAFLPHPSLAQEQYPNKAAHILIYVIEASNEGKGVDPQIQHLVKEFRGALRYSSYELVSKIPRRLEPGEKEEVKLPGHREMQLRMQGYEGNRISLKVEIKEKADKGRHREVLNTEFRIIEGGTIMIGGYEYHGGKLLIAISAK
jgi:hypothetical protein